MEVFPPTIGAIGEYHWIEWVPTHDVILPDLVHGGPGGWEETEDRLQRIHAAVTPI